MKFNLSPISNGVKLKKIDDTLEFEILVTESIDLSNVVEEIANTYELIEVDYSDMILYKENDSNDDNYNEILSLARIIMSLITAHTKTINDQKTIENIASN